MMPSVFNTNACPLARGKSNYALGKCVSCTGCPFGQVVNDNSRAAGTRIKSKSCSKITWSLFWNFSQVNIEGEWKTSTVTGPYADTLSISFSAMFFFTSKYSRVSLYPVLSRTCHELPNFRHISTLLKVLKTALFSLTNKERRQDRKY